MKTYTNRPPGLFKMATIAVIGFVASTVFVQGTAFATTAANAVISNTATVSWEDSNNLNPTSTTASVDVTVLLLEATPTLSQPTDQTVASNSPANYTYSITSNANGLDTYNLSSAQGTVTGTLDSVTVGFFDDTGTTPITSIDLGATSVATAALLGATSITVPADGNDTDSSINGIEVNDTIAIGVNTYTVSGITDNATGTSTITLSSGLLAGVSVATPIGEQAQFIFRVTPVTSTGATVDYTVSARDDANAQSAATDTTTTTVTFNAPNLTVTKYVRNITAGTTGAGSCINYDTGLNAAPGTLQYCVGATTGQPGDILEYVIEIVNSGGQARDVIITDPVPAYTAYSTANKMSLDGTILNDDENGGDAGETDNATIYIYAGSTPGSDGAAGVGNGTGGTLNNGETTRGAFRVTIQ